MDIEQLKDKIGDELFTQLSTFIQGLESAKAEARRESIDGRRTLKARVAELEGFTQKALEKMGIDSVDDLESMPDLKAGQADAVRQLDTKLKRIERERDEFKTKAEQSTGLLRKAKEESVIATALNGKQFIDTEVAAALMRPRIKWDGDEIYFEAESGKLVPIDEGAAWLAKSKPSLVKAQGSAGSGYRDGGGESGVAKNPFAKDTFNLTEQFNLQRTNPQLAASMKAAASS
jgi:hypothetical protein